MHVRCLLRDNFDDFSQLQNLTNCENESHVMKCLIVENYFASA